MGKIGGSYKLKSCLLKQEVEHDECYEDIWIAREQEWLPYVKNDVLSTAFCYASYTTGMEKIKKFGIKNSLILSSSANKFFNSLRDENDRTIYTYTDPFMRKSVRKSKTGGRCNAFNQHYISEFSDDVFNSTAKELNINGNKREFLEKYIEFLNKHEKQSAKESDSKNDV